MKMLFKREKLYHYIFPCIPLWVDFLNGIIFAYKYTQIGICVIHVYICIQANTCICLHTYMYYLWNISIFCVCYILNKSAILWVDLTDTSASYILWALFEERFRVFAQCLGAKKRLCWGALEDFVICPFRIALWETTTREPLNHMWAHREGRAWGNQECLDIHLSGAVTDAVPWISAAASRGPGTAPAVSCSLDCCLKPLRLQRPCGRVTHKSFEGSEEWE